MQQTRIFRLLEGYRDRPAADLGAIAEAWCGYRSSSSIALPCSELDINPLLADETGVDRARRPHPHRAERSRDGGAQSAARDQALSQSMGAMGINRERLSHLDPPDQAWRRASLWSLRRQALAGGHPLPLPRPAQGVLPQVHCPLHADRLFAAPWPSWRSTQGTEASCSASRGLPPTGLYERRICRDRAQRSEGSRYRLGADASPHPLCRERRACANSRRCARRQHAHARDVPRVSASTSPSIQRIRRCPRCG